MCFLYIVYVRVIMYFTHIKFVCSCAKSVCMFSFCPFLCVVRACAYKKRVYVHVEDRDERERGEKRRMNRTQTSRRRRSRRKDADR